MFEALGIASKYIKLSFLTTTVFIDVNIVNLQLKG